jgi:hypothetical protein
MLFKDKLNEIFGMGAPTVAMQPQEPKDVIELTPIEDFRQNVRAKLNGIKDNAVMGVVTNAPAQAPTPCAAASPEVIVERDNEIGLNTLKGSIKKMGPQKVAEIIGKLSTEKKEVDKATGIATSEFDKFVDGLKQEAAEALLGSEVTPDASSPTPSPTGDAQAPTQTGAPKAPAEKLDDLVQTKL